MRSPVHLAAMLALASVGLAVPTGYEVTEDDMLPVRRNKSKKRRATQTATAKPGPHPAMPEDGWPITRQQRRARERAMLK